MTGYTAGVLLLVIVFVLVYFGLAQRVLDRLYLTDKVALSLLVAMIAGSFINIPLSTGPILISVNVGGALIPLGLAIYILYRAGNLKEVTRALFVAGATAVVLYGISLYTRGDRGEPWTFGYTGLMDPLFYYPLVAGLVAYIVGRSRRAAFVGAILGVIILDIVDLAYYWYFGLRGTVAFGGAGIVDVTFMAAVIAVLIAELVGELRERLQGGPREAGHAKSLLSALRTPLPKLFPVGKRDDRGEERNDKK